MDLGIRGRTAIVCASSQGLGKACARALAEAGVSLVINGRNHALLEQTAEEIRQATGVQVQTVTADVSSAAGQAAAQTATIEMTTDPTPPHKGANNIRLVLRDSFGAPIDGANVSIVFYMPPMPAMAMAAMRRVANANGSGGGVYTAAINLDSGGGWQVSMVASKAGNQVATLQTNVTASGGMKEDAP